MFLGVDESNHGRLPEIFVGCYSPEIQNTSEREFSKARRREERYLLNLPYKHILFNGKEKDILGKENFQIVASCEFARHFSTKSLLKKIFIDGKMPSTKEAMLREMLDYFIENPPEIIAEAFLDERIAIVREADLRAHILYRYYIKKDGRLKKDYLPHIITPKLEDYVPFLH